MAIHKVKFTEEEAKKLIEENKLEPEKLEDVNGGFRHWVRYEGWEIIDDETGERVGDRYWGNSSANTEAIRKLGLSITEISDEELEALRTKGIKPYRENGYRY